MEPLLDRIKRDPTTVVCPVIDVIDDNTFEYHYSKAYFTNVGGFDWGLQFNWHAIPERDRKNRSRAIDPVRFVFFLFFCGLFQCSRSPTMAGGLFSIDKKYFEKLGTYDPGFDIWGGENLELSFKIWMCGGTLEIVPCSHVGHVFRKRSPYKWRTGVNVLKRNSVRLAEVWLDDYKQYYYERINNQIVSYLNIFCKFSFRETLGIFRIVKSFVRTWDVNRLSGIWIIFSPSCLFLEKVLLRERLAQFLCWSCQRDYYLCQKL